VNFSSHFPHTSPDLGETCYKKYAHTPVRVCEFREQTRCRGRTSVVVVNEITFKGASEHHTAF